MASTFEIAKQCPKCSVPGEDRKQYKSKESTTHVIYCVNPRCKWYDTPWNVSVMKDGSVPDPQDFYKREKQYVGFAGDDVAAQRLINQLTAEYEESIKNDTGKPRR